MVANAPIWILHATAGEGHRHAALALQAAFQHRGVEAHVSDALDFAPRWFRWWFQGGYETLVRRFPRLWGTLYHGADEPGFFYRFQTMLDLACLRRLDVALAHHRPAWVLCTHSLPQPRLDRFLRHAVAGTYRPRVAVVVTDLHPHRMWLRGQPDLYFVPNEECRQRLITRRPDAAEHVMVSGIPVDPLFAEGRSRAEAKAELGIAPELPYLVLMSGGIGGGPIARALTAILGRGASPSKDLPFRMTVVCGRSASARETCLASIAGQSVAVEVEGFVPHERIRTMLQAADLLIGKPGGLTMSEALACGTPMVVYRPLLIPGQEEDNAAYLVAHGAACVVRDDGELRETVALLLRDRDTLGRMQEVAHRLGRPRAALDIAEAVLAASHSSVAGV